jgi:hypothetical protein
MFYLKPEEFFPGAWQLEGTVFELVRVNSAMALTLFWCGSILTLFEYAPNRSNFLTAETFPPHACKIASTKSCYFST